MMSLKKENALLAKAARSGRVVKITRTQGNALSVDVEFMSQRARVRFMVLDGDTPSRIDPPCPIGQHPGEWTAECDRVVRAFEPMLCDALGLPTRGRLTRHLAEFAWSRPLDQRSDCSASTAIP